MPRHHNPNVMTGISLFLPITLTTMAVVLLAPILPLMMAQFSGVVGHQSLVPMVLTMPVTPIIIGITVGRTGSFYSGLAYIGIMAALGALSYAFIVNRVERLPDPD